MRNATASGSEQMGWILAQHDGWCDWLVVKITRSLACINIKAFFKGWTFLTMSVILLDWTFKFSCGKGYLRCIHFFDGSNATPIGCMRSACYKVALQWQHFIGLVDRFKNINGKFFRICAPKVMQISWFLTALCKNKRWSFYWDTGTPCTSFSLQITGSSSPCETTLFSTPSSQPLFFWLSRMSDH